MNPLEFNKTYRTRTLNLASIIIQFYSSINSKNEAIRIIGKQLMRSSTSVGANFRAACVARSNRERFAKLSIVVEEADETLYWLELIVEGNLLSKNSVANLMKETDEIVAMTVSSIKTLRKKS